MTDRQGWRIVYNPLITPCFLKLFTCLGDLLIAMLRLTQLSAALVYRARLNLLWILFALSACSGPQTVPEVQQPAPVSPPVVKPVPPVVSPQPAPTPAVPHKVAIVLSADVDIYNDVATRLNKKLEQPAQVYALTGNRKKDSKIVAELQSSDSAQLVAIGLRAARALSTVQHKPVVFAYVLNYRDHNLLRPAMKGVSVLPGAEQLFRDWKAISPQLQKVAVLSGPGLGDYIRHATEQAASQNIELRHVPVKTDKEFLYRSKKLPLDVQGQWIIPDNRVLSRKVLKETLTYNAKSGKQTVVFSPKLLDVGGLFYSRISHDEITDSIYQRLLDCGSGPDIPGEDMLLLRRHEMGINPVVARQLGLNIPPAYRKFMNE